MEVTTQDKIKEVYDNMKSLSLYKNEKYGDSALNPMKIFCRESTSSQIESRLDDKLSRIKNSTELRKNDVSDIMGYLALLCIDREWLNFDEFKD
jgi:hypothetical protein